MFIRTKIERQIETELTNLRRLAPGSKEHLRQIVAIRALIKTLHEMDTE